MDGFGRVSWWGFSPALDLTALHGQGPSNVSVDWVDYTCTAKSDCVSVLLVGSGDLRHLLYTLAQASNHTSKPIHFYIIESCLEVMARHMLFLALLMESPDAFGLQEKAEMFMELYGNSLIRTHTSEYLKTKATDLIKMITDDDYLKLCLPLLDVSSLKFKEKDFLEGIFKFWRNPDDKTFDISKYWDSRLRNYLGVRYDSRSGAYDWDYHMKLQEVAPSISGREYSEWRESGIAFQLREGAPYEASNRTLASGLLLTQDGEKVVRQGYWGDIINSPYLSFGIQSDNRDLFKSQHGKHVYSSVNISNYNITSLIYKLTTGEEYSPSATNPFKLSQSSFQDGNAAGCRKKMVNEKVVGQDFHGEGGPQGGDCTARDASKTGGPLFSGAYLITFLPLGWVPELSQKAKYRKLFNIAYFSNSMVHHLKSGLEIIFAPGCTLVIETARFMLDLKDEQKCQYEAKATSMAAALGFKVPLVTSDSMAAYLAFIS